MNASSTAKMTPVQRLVSRVPGAQLDPEAPPWLDRPEADNLWQASSETNALSATHRTQLSEWRDKGAILISGVFSEEECDELANRTKRRVWTDGTDLPPTNKVTGLVDPVSGEVFSATPAELAVMSPERREAVYRSSSWRYHRFCFNDEVAGTFAQRPEIVDIVSLIFGDVARPSFSISFGNGSEQQLHQDIAVFHIEPRGFLVGVWIALEDIDPGSGPLRYFPGSHKLGLWDKHAMDYPMSNMRTGTAQDRNEYEAWLERESKENFEEVHLTIPKGSVLVWHSDLAHGGSPWLDHSRSRHSLVVHYLPTSVEVNKAAEVTGPTLW